MQGAPEVVEDETDEEDDHEDGHDGLRSVHCVGREKDLEGEGERERLGRE